MQPDTDNSSHRADAVEKMIRHHLEEATRLRAERDRPEPPFKTGDLVELKSGGHHMVVEYIDRHCDESFQVGVMWAGMVGQFEVNREQLPAVCLQRVPVIDGKTRPAMVSYGDTIAF